MKGSKHSSIGKSYEIDQRAIKIFESALPDNWISRRQQPDFFVDYLVEFVEHGEPTGLHFAAQIKGYEDTPDNKKPLSYSFKTKHLKYYLHRSQHPVVLFLVNVTSREGYWIFIQKFLKEKVSAKILDKQDSLTVHFLPEDNLSNLEKFKCLLPEAEQFVRDLHPGSVRAAVQKRQSELESIDPRCSVSISIRDGKEQIFVSPKETFSFKTRIRSKDTEGWRKFFECGTAVKVNPGEMEIIGAPLLEAEFGKMDGYAKIQFGIQHPASTQIFCGVGENITVLQIEGETCAGTKFLTFKGALPDSPIEIAGEIALDSKFSQEAIMNFFFSLDAWAEQEILLLSHFDQTEALVRALSESQISQMRILIRGNLLWAGKIGGCKVNKMKNLLYPIEWLKKCRWIAQHCNVNPKIPSLKKVSKDKWDAVEDLYCLLKNKEISVPMVGHVISFVTSTPSLNKVADSNGSLMIQNVEQMVDFFGVSIRLGPIRTIFNGLKFISRTQSETGGIKSIFETGDKTKRTTMLISE